MAELRRVLGLRDVVLFNIVAIFALRGVTTASKLGPLAVPLWVAAVALFFIPLALAVTELSTRDPAEGGFYRWTRAAFGDAHGFIAAWSYWLSNLTYLPSMLFFLAAAAAFVGGDGALGDSPVFAVSLSLVVLGLLTVLNVRGLRAARYATGAGAIAGWLATIVLVGAGATLLFRFGSATSFTPASMTRPAGGGPALAYFGTLAFGLVGLELAPVMGGEIKDPARTVPRGIAISGAVITALYIAGTVAVLVAVTAERVSPIAGVVEAVQVVGERVAWPWIVPLVALLLCASVTGQLTAWLAGEARLPLALGLDRFLPAAMASLHPRYGTPHVAIVMQSVVAGLLVVLAQAGSTVREAFLLLLDTTVVLTFVPFLYIFLSLPLLRPAGPEPGVVRVRGPRGALWLVALSGTAATLATLASAVIPPAEVDPVRFEARLWGGLVTFTAAGYLLYRRFARARGAASG